MLHSMNFTISTATNISNTYICFTTEAAQSTTMKPGCGIWPMVPVPTLYDTDMGTGYSKIQLGYSAKFQDTAGVE